jgi:type IV pilus assembly protein PilO
MTYSEDLINTTQIGDSTYLDDRPSYPSIFGIDLSPMLLGSVLALAGIAGAGYLIYSNVAPLYQANQEQQTKLADVQKQIKDRQNMAKKIAEAEIKLKTAEAQRETVLSLFANEEKLDTLLIDLNKLVGDRQGQLQSFKPDQATTGTGPIVDSSLGAALNNKLRRKSIDIDVRGGFEQMQSILRTVERMDQLLIMQNFRADLQTIDTNNPLLNQGQPPRIKTTFKLQAIIPLTESKLASSTPSTSASPVSQSETDKKLKANLSKENAAVTEEARKKVEAAKSR